MTTEVTVRDNPDRSRLEAVLADGRVAGYAHYRAGRLAEGVVAHAREQGLRIEPTCSFLRVHFARHPDTHDVLAEGVELG
jgi:hypothetical protein